MENLRVIGICLLIVALFCAGCDGNDENVPVVGFIEAFEDATNLAIMEMEEAGVDVISDGEMKRFNFLVGFYDYIQDFVTKFI